MATPNIVPRADSEGGLGTASKYWASAYIDLIYVGAGKVGRDADNLLDFSADNHLTLRLNASNALVFDGARVYPNSNDGYALGLASNSFSDLFLASGAVINFNNGDVTLTHASNALTLDGGHLQLTTNFEARFGSSNRLRIYSDNTDGYIQNTATDGDIIFQADNGSGTATAYLTLDGGIVKTTVHKPLKFDDNISAEYGADTDLIMYHSGSNGAIENYTGNLTITNTVHGGDIFLKAENSSGTLHTYLQVDGGSERTIFSKNLRLSDDVQLDIGSSDDFRIVHTSANNATFVKNFTGDLTISSNKQDKDIIFQGDDGQASDNTITTYFYLDGSSAEHDGSATTALYTNWPDKSRISLGSSHDLQLEHNSADSVIRNEVGDLYITQKADDKDIILQASTGSASPATYLTLDGSDATMRAGKKLNFADNIKTTFGISDDLQIYHDGSNSHIDETGTGELRIRASALRLQANENENAIICNANGSVDLYHDGSASPKLSTTSTGITVTGAVNGIPFFSDTTNNSMYTHDVSGTDDSAVGNTAYGFAALDAITTGDYNVAIGNEAGGAINTGERNVLVGYAAGDALTTGGDNTAIGHGALSGEQQGGRNVAIGHQALLNQNSATYNYNVAIGYAAGKEITTGTSNVIVGGLAGDAITDGTVNTLIGYQAGSSLTSGSANVAIGYLALATEDAHGRNIAIGQQALEDLNAGLNANNIAIGYDCGKQMTTGTLNTIVGNQAGDALTSGNSNVVMGYLALSSETLGDRNIAMGTYALQNQNNTSDTDAYNVAVGYAAAQDLTTGLYNTVVGGQAGKSITTGIRNTLVGGIAGDNITVGRYNVAMGYHALGDNLITDYNVAIGYDALRDLVGDGSTVNQNTYNVAVGALAGQAITSGFENTIMGALAGDALTTGSGNVAIGFEALSTEDGHGTNVAIGKRALKTLNAGSDSYNVAIGFDAGKTIDTGTLNTIVGGLAGDALTDGASNTAVGYQALSAETGGDENTAIGIQALRVSVGGSNNTAIGRRAGVAVSSGDNNTIIGHDAGGIQGGSNNIIIGKDATASAVSDSNTTVIGTTTTTSALVHGLKQPVTSANASVAANVATPNTIYVFGDADGATVTLPDSGSGTELGKTYEFVTTVTATSNAHKIVCTDTTNERIMGSVTMVDTDSSDAVRVFSSQYSAENSAISMNGSTTGGVAGTKIKITNVATDIWIAEAVILHTGDVATPFATS